MALRDGIIGVGIIIAVVGIAIGGGIIFNGNGPQNTDKGYELISATLWEEGGVQYLGLTGTGDYPLDIVSISDGYVDTDLVWVVKSRSGDTEVMQLASNLDLSGKWYVIYNEHVFKAYDPGY